MASSTISPATTSSSKEVSLAWTIGYQCPSCSVFIPVPEGTWATCSTCPPVPATAAAELLLSTSGFDTDTAARVIASLRPLLDLAQPGRTLSVVTGVPDPLDTAAQAPDSDATATEPEPGDSAHKAWVAVVSTRAPKKIRSTKSHHQRFRAGAEWAARLMDSNAEIDVMAQPLPRSVQGPQVTTWFLEGAAWAVKLVDRRRKREARLAAEQASAA